MAIYFLLSLSLLIEKVSHADEWTDKAGKRRGEERKNRTFISNKGRRTRKKNLFSAYFSYNDAQSRENHGFKAERAGPNQLTLHCARQKMAIFKVKRKKPLLQCVGEGIPNWFFSEKRKKMLIFFFLSFTKPKILLHGIFSYIIMMMMSGMGRRKSYGVSHVSM